MSGQDRPDIPTARGRRFYRLLLRAYPPSVRRRFGDEMVADFERMSHAARQHGLHGRLGLAGRLLVDWLRTTVRERFTEPSLPGNGHGGGFPPMRFELLQSFRRLWATPGFSVVVAIVLALGLGPAIAAYGIADAILLKPLPGVRNQGDLALIRHGRPLENGEGFTVGFISYPDLKEIESRIETLSGIAGIQGSAATLELESGVARAIQAREVTASYFSVLGLRPVAGRVFQDDEDRPPADGVGIALLSHRLATAMFGDPERAVGETIRLSGTPVEVIGVLPEGFRGLERPGTVDVWRPRAQPFARPSGVPPPGLRTDRSRGAFYEFVARLRPGATWDHARTELAGLNAWLAETWPEENEGYAEHQFLVYPGVGVPPFGRENLTQTLWLIGAIALCVLAIACANSAGLLFLRSLARREELAVQKALGASPTRLTRQVLLDAILLSALGAGTGLVLAETLLRIFGGTRLAGLTRPLEGLGIDWRAAIFTAGVTIAVAVLASLLPTSEVRRLDPGPWITNSARTSTGRGRGWQAALGALQVAVTIPLVVGGLLFTQTLWKLLEVEPGFDPAGVRVIAFDTGSPALQGPEGTRHLVRLAERLESRPEVNGAAVAERFPFTCCGMSSWIQRPGDEERLDIQENAVTGDYFEVLGIPLLAGRTFREDEVLDFEGQNFGVVILNARAAAALFGGPARAVGREVQFPYRVRQGLTYRVIGVVGDVRLNDLTEPPPLVAYTPLGPWGLMMGARIVTRSTDDDAALLGAITRAAADVDPGRLARPMEEISSIEASMLDHLSERRVLAHLFLLLAGIGLALATVGLGAATTRNVVSRTREIGVRRALGAARYRVVVTLLRGLALVVAIGGIAGISLAAVGARWLESRLYGVATGDPLTWACVGLVLGATVLAAGVIPTYRAVKVDPAGALRHEA